MLFIYCRHLDAMAADPGSILDTDTKPNLNEEWFNNEDQDFTVIDEAIDDSDRKFEVKEEITDQDDIDGVKTEPVYDQDQNQDHATAVKPEPESIPPDQCGDGSSIKTEPVSTLDLISSSDIATAPIVKPEVSASIEWTSLSEPALDRKPRIPTGYRRMCVKVAKLTPFELRLAKHPKFCKFLAAMPRVHLERLPEDVVTGVQNRDRGDIASGYDIGKTWLAESERDRPTDDTERQVATQSNMEDKIKNMILDQGIKDGTVLAKKTSSIDEPPTAKLEAPPPSTTSTPKPKKVKAQQLQQQLVKKKKKKQKSIDPANAPFLNIPGMPSANALWNFRIKKKTPPPSSPPPTATTGTTTAPAIVDQKSPEKATTKTTQKVSAISSFPIEYSSPLVRLEMEMAKKARKEDEENHTRLRRPFRQSTFIRKSDDIARTRESAGTTGMGTAGQEYSARPDMDRPARSRRQVPLLGSKPAAASKEALDDEGGSPSNIGFDDDDIDYEPKRTRDTDREDRGRRGPGQRNRRRSRGRSRSRSRTRDRRDQARCVEDRRWSGRSLSRGRNRGGRSLSRGTRGRNGRRGDRSRSRTQRSQRSQRSRSRVARSQDRNKRHDRDEDRKSRGRSKSRSRIRSRDRSLEKRRDRSRSRERDRDRKRRKSRSRSRSKSRSQKRHRTSSPSRSRRSQSRSRKSHVRSGPRTPSPTRPSKDRQKPKSTKKKRETISPSASSISGDGHAADKEKTDEAPVQEEQPNADLASVLLCLASLQPKPAPVIPDISLLDPAVQVLVLATLISSAGTQPTPEPTSNVASNMGFIPAPANEATTSAAIPSQGDEVTPESVRLLREILEMVAEGHLEVSPAQKQKALELLPLMDLIEVKVREQPGSISADVLTQVTTFVRECFGN